MTIRRTNWNDSQTGQPNKRITEPMNRRRSAARQLLVWCVAAIAATTCHLHKMPEPEPQENVNIYTVVLTRQTEPEPARPVRHPNRTRWKRPAILRQGRAIKTLSNGRPIPNNQTDGDQIWSWGVKVQLDGNRQRKRNTNYFPRSGPAGARNKIRIIYVRVVSIGRHRHQTLLRCCSAEQDSGLTT